MAIVVCKANETESSVSRNCPLLLLIAPAWAESLDQSTLIESQSLNHNRVITLLQAKKTPGHLVV